MSDRDNSIEPDWYHPEQMPYRYFGDVFIGSDHGLTVPEHRNIIGIMRTQNLRRHQDVIERDNGIIVTWTALYAPSGFQSLPEDDNQGEDQPQPDRTHGVWVAYLPNSPRAMIFETEIEALRAAVEHSAKCKFWEFGEELNPSPTAEEVYQKTLNELRRYFYPVIKPDNPETDNDNETD